ncbi:MAG: amino acid adenylation domain-containing protein [Gammaproteobacteria bacterium]|nr:amino acid adenylation domain-containing protein [Gammaproteobacteria bacterium]
MNYPPYKDIYLLHQTIALHAERDPDATAFRFQDESISYAGLYEQASRLSSVLYQLNIQPGDRVGIFVFKSLHTAISVYGILSAGAVYVPLDPLMPESRLTRIICDCNLEVIISERSRLPILRKAAANARRLRAVIGVENSGDEFEGITWSDVSSQPASHTRPVSVVEEDLAYIMYTSGSTGVPKGLMHTHKSGLSYAKQSAHTYGLSPSDRLGNHAPLHFDMSTMEYLAAPLVGATTIIVPEDHTKIPVSLAQLIENEKLTIWYSVPFALIQLLLHGLLHERNLSSLRWIIYGGEPFPTKYLKELMVLFSNARFSNSYGPAEVNQCTFYHIPATENYSDDSVPIGKPWGNTQVLVVDEQDNTVAPGETGELLVRSPTMMLGYWGQQEMTARSVFIDCDKYGVEKKFYRTGDLVCARPDGELLFMGRKDRQIKSRGYRIELDEIESALYRCDGVQEAAAYGVDGTDGSQSIESAVILKNGANLNSSTLKKLISAHLPTYALPQRITIMSEFPRTGSNKIDRLALARSIGGQKQTA